MTWAKLWEAFTDKLADEWRQAWKWLSVQLGAAIAVAPMLYGESEPLRDVIGDDWFRRIMTVLGLLVVINAVKKK